MISQLKDFSIPELGPARRGKVREVFELEDRLVMIASDRISCFDCILDKPIPYKGQILTDISCYWFDQSKDIIPNHLISQPHGNVMLAKKCRVIPVEMIVRAYITGSMWRDYEAGKRDKCGIRLPEGMKKNEKLTCPIITPSTKARHGHDEDISKEALIKRGTVSKALWDQLETAALRLFERGSQILAQRGITLVDTKYEFGIDADGTLTLIDEIHTPDSSRFWFESDGQDQELKSPDKEYVRGWLLERGFKGEGQVPSLDEAVVNEASKRYRAVYERLLGKDFVPSPALIEELTRNEIIQGHCALLLCNNDREWLDKVTCRLSAEGIAWRSVELTEQALESLIKEAELSLEPLVFLASPTIASDVTGRIESQCKWPLIKSADSDCAHQAAQILKHVEVKL